MNTYDILISGLQKIPGIDNGNDRLVAPFRGSLEYDQKRFLGIPENETIVYIRIIDADRTVPCSLAITEKGIYYRMINKFFWATVQDKKFSIQFCDNNQVDYSEREDSYIFSDGSTISRRSLVKNLDSCYRQTFAHILEEATKSVTGVIDLFNRGIDLMKAEKYAEALSEFNKGMQLAKEDGELLKSDELAYGYFYIGRCQMFLDKDIESKNNLIIAKEIASKSHDADLKELLPVILSNLAYVVDSRIESHKLLTEAYDKAPSSDAQKELLEELSELHNSEKFRKEFSSKDSVSERKAILVLRDNSTPVFAHTLLGLEKSLIGKLNLSFPIGHPVVGKVYFAHPARTGFYIPKEKYDEAIFLEKVNEYCYLLQCLGAREINIHKLYGHSIEEMNSSTINADASFGGKTFGVSGRTNYEENQTTKNSKNYAFSNHIKFVPKDKPFVPLDLNWLAIEPRWKRLIDNRLKGSLDYYVEEISTSSDNLLSNSEKISLDLEINALIRKFEGHLDIEDISSSNTNKSTTWRIEVKF